MYQLIWNHSPNYSLIVLNFTPNAFYELFLQYITMKLSLLLNAINYHYYRKQIILKLSNSCIQIKFIKATNSIFKPSQSFSPFFFSLSRIFFCRCLRALWSWCIPYVFFVTFSRHIFNTLVYYCAFPQLLSWNQLINKIHSLLKELT